MLYHECIYDLDLALGAFEEKVKISLDFNFDFGVTSL